MDLRITVFPYQKSNCTFSLTELRQTLLLSCRAVKCRPDRSLVASLPLSSRPGRCTGERLSQLDLRLARPVRLGRTKTTFQFDRYNALNVDTVTGIHTNYASWL